MAEDAKLTKTDPINMNGIAGFPGTVGDIGSFYDHLLSNWINKRPDIGWDMAVIGDEGHLRLAADWVYFRHTLDQNIVIFGHTHKAELVKHYIMEEAPAVQNHDRNLSCRSIYANSGAWVDSVQNCTYLETQEDAAAGRHYVRLWTYPSKNLLQEAFVKL